MATVKKKLDRRTSDSKDQILQQIVAAADKSRADATLVQPSGFIRRFYRDVSAEDLNERQAADLAGAALSTLSFGRKRKPRTPLIRVFNPDLKKDGFTSQHSIVQMINDDMPFLVDSLSMVILREGLNIHLTVHPILSLVRSAHGVLKTVELRKKPSKKAKYESCVLLEIDRISDPETIAKLEQAVCDSMRDVRAATQDWKAMLAKLEEICDQLQQDPPPLDPEDVSEGLALLRWMTEDHFTLLGYREYRLAVEKGETVLLSIPETGLGILQHQPQSRESQRNPAVLRAIKQQAKSRELLVLTKANSKATVHRPGYLDYIGVKTFDKKGNVCGEMRFLGLFTSAAYSRSPREIPVLRRKVEQVMAQSGLVRRSHGAKALLHILETYPRDELFQISVEDLSRIGSGILSLQERQRVKLFIRRDFYLRFYSCLVFVPRDKYNTQVRRRIQQLLLDGFGGSSLESSVQMSDSNLARLHIIVRTPVNASPSAAVADLEKAIAGAVRTWSDRLRQIMVERFDEEQGLKQFHEFGDCFPAAYTEDVSPRGASFDIQRMQALGHDADSLRMSLYRPETFSEKRLRFKLFRRHNPIPISDALPMLENMGLKVISERPYRLVLKDKTLLWIQDFEMEFDHQDSLDLRESNRLFQDTFAAAWRGQAENDGFNRLVLRAGLTWHQTALLRAIAKFLLQTGLPFSALYMEQLICGRPDVAALLVQRFETAFDPAIGDTVRQRRLANLDTQLTTALNSLVTLDEDRLFRAYLAVEMAALRTNYFQKDNKGNDHKPYLSIKFRCADLPDLPLPRPLFEIFVYSPRFEAIHLRGGKIARGGLRWSDRREDFRTEVLGLMKAQTVKNTLIVPTGAKGGFVVKTLPKGGPEVVMPVVIDCYKQFICGMLDITDNLVENQLVPPPDVVRHDGDDPYLVVAADKGTATFSDIANGVSRSYRFWLDDAFASGGSAGYDHKKMGITAKGAWEAVKRHFREMGKDIQNEPFTAAGIGDMAGDVFGNGMLRSPHTRLLAAFNHVHIFLDPDPDAAASFAERQRLFNLPRSSWLDYDAKLISEGGGVFARSEKSIPLSPQVQAMLKIKDSKLRPSELISAILRMPVDLLWNGGIGTYVKASHESHAQAGDRANDGLRVDASALRCKVVGEGGNLGFTQLARVEYAQNDGRINTDFIDNSAGVDCSDREVNIKILLNLASLNRKLSRTRRDKLLVSMTDEVDSLVLRDNYLQTQAISMLENHAAERLNEHSHQMRQLEASGELNRQLEFLPDDEQLEERQRSKRGLTRPELAVILSYSKISLYNELSRSNIASDPYLSGELLRYFPLPLQKRYPDLMDDHRLRTELIATQVTNSIVNRMGCTFARRVYDESGAPYSQIARAYTAARETYDTRSLWDSVEELDNVIHANAQYSMIMQSARLLRRVTLWLLEHYPQDLNIAAVVAKFQPGIAVIGKRLPSLLVGPELARFNEALRIYIDLGAPEKLARRMAGLHSMYSGLDIVDVAHGTESEEAFVAGVYFRLGSALKLGWILEQIEKLAVRGRWQAVARSTLRENLFAQQRLLTAQVIGEARTDTASDAVLSWLDHNALRVQRAHKTLDEMKTAGVNDFATLSVAIQEIRKLTASKGR